MWKQAAIVIPSLLLICCGNPQNRATQQVFSYNEDAGITSLDPAFAKDQPAIWAVSQLYSGLVQLDEHLNVVPCVARNWEISPDGKTYTFHLRSDVYFHEVEAIPQSKNRTVTATDFVYSFWRVTDPALASPGAWIFHDKMDEIGRVFKGQTPTGYVNASNPDKPLPFEAINDSTLVIRLNQAFPPFLGMLTMPYCYAVLPEAVHFYGQDFRSHPAGSGPFRFKFWEEGVKLVLEKNHTYFEKDPAGNALPYLDAISVSFIQNRQTAFMEFVQGKLDFLNGLDGGYKDELLTRSGQLKEKYRDRFSLLTAPFLNTEFLEFLVDDNLPRAKQSPVRDRRVRQAISCAINRDEMVKFLRNNIGNPDINGFIPDGLPKQSRSYAHTYAPQKAKQLLAEAGYPQGKGLAPIRLYTTAQYLDLAVFIQQQLAEVSIPLKIEVNQPSALRDLKSKSELEFFRGSWIADYPDAENYLATFYSGNFSPGGPNYCHFKNAEFDRLYNLSLQTVNDSARYDIYRRMEDILEAEMPAVVLFYDQSIRLASKKVQGLKTNPMNWLVLKNVKIEQ